jgi:hypothetical protein
MKTDTNMARITGLSKRPGSRFYQLCTVIPQEIRAAYGGKRTLRTSLGTEHRREAELLATQELARLLEEFNTKRLILPPQRLDTVTPEMSSELAQRVRAVVLSRDDTARDDPKVGAALSELSAVMTRSALTVPPDVPAAPVVGSDALSGLSEGEATALAALNDLMSADAAIKLASRNLKAILPLVKEEAHKLGLTFDPQAPGAREALTASLKAYRTARHEVIQRDAGEVVDTPTVSSTPKATSSANKAPKSLRDVFDRWIKSGDTPRSADSIAAMDRALRQFEGQHPKVALMDITRDMGDIYRAWLIANCTASKTARGRLTAIKTLLKYAAGTLEWTQRHTWAGLDIKAKVTSPRRPITDAELVTLFTTPCTPATTSPRQPKGERMPPTGFLCLGPIPVPGWVNSANSGPLTSKPWRASR